MAKIYAPKLTTTRGHSVRIGNMDMYYEEYGAGKPLLLLHGFGGCTQNWHAFTDRLSEQHRLIVVDLRGHGHSTNPENKFTHRRRPMMCFTCSTSWALASVLPWA